MPALSFSRFRGIAYRATSYDTPLWVFPNRRAGRWSDPDDQTIAQYCTLDAAAPMAEFLRHEDLRIAAEAAELRLSTWQLRLAEGAILDLSTPAKAGEQGIPWEELLSDDWAFCQELGREIQAAGGRGVVAPCAALPGSMSITVFGARSEISWNAEPRLAIQVPARAMHKGAPGPGIVQCTRFFGEDYPAAVSPTPVAHMLST